MAQASDAIVLPQDANEPIYRRNFFFFLSDGILFSVALSIVGTTTVIPDFIRNLTDSEILIGLSSSLFDIGFTLPQLLIARYIIRVERKKWWFVGPNIPVRFVMLIFGLIVFLLGASQPQTILISFFICYSIVAFGDGLVGVPWADLVGTSLNSRWRARFFGIMSASAGLIMLALAPLIGLILGESGPGFPTNYAILFAASGTLFALSIIPTLFIHELPGGKAVEKLPSLGEFLPSLGTVLKTDVPFRSIVIARMFTSLFAMASPFYIGFATIQLGLSSTVAVPTLLAMQTIGGIGGALLYTWIGAKNNVLFLRLALAGAAILPISALIAAIIGPFPLYIGFLVSGLTLSNLFLSFQNWVITYATPDQRPIYAGLFNTIAAVITMITPFIAGTIAQTIGYEPLFVVALIMVFSALFITVRYVHESESQPKIPVTTEAA